MNLGAGPAGYDGAAQRVKFRKSAQYRCYGQVRVDRNKESEATWQAQSVQVPDRNQGQNRTQAKHGLQNKSGEPGLAAPPLNLLNQHVPERKTCPGIAPLSLPSL